jgi:hypothetical protein
VAQLRHIYSRHAVFSKADSCNCATGAGAKNGGITRQNGPFAPQKMRVRIPYPPPDVVAVSAASRATPTGSSASSGTMATRSANPRTRAI